jgi:hypothetical protein
MKMKNIVIAMLVCLTACYGINERTSEIGNLETKCFQQKDWENVKKIYSAKTTDSSFLETINEIKSKTFNTEILFFDTNPKEIIAIATDHYSVRYVYNSDISNQVLDGLSSELNDSEKKRITDRIQKLLNFCECK